MELIKESLNCAEADFHDKYKVELSETKILGRITLFGTFR